MPSEAVLHVLATIKPLRSAAERLGRRNFRALKKAPKIQGRAGEWRRLFARALGRGNESLSYDANDWLMETMARASHLRRVSAIHSYEDCSLKQFQTAKRLGKPCIYDMPIGYYRAWQRIQADLIRHYVDWLPAHGAQPSISARLEQKREEMQLADLVLVPSNFVAKTIYEFWPHKTIISAPYGADTDFWVPGTKSRASGPLRFLYAGQLSLRKGTPLLLSAWRKAALKDATLTLVGSWRLSESKRHELPANVTCLPACSREQLREQFQKADVFLFPSYFEGLAIVLLEALACGIPAIATDSSGASELIEESCGKIVSSGNLDELVTALRTVANWSDEMLLAHKAAARRRAMDWDWKRYRSHVIRAVRDVA